MEDGRGGEDGEVTGPLSHKLSRELLQLYLLPPSQLLPPSTTITTIYHHYFYIFLQTNNATLTPKCCGGAFVYAQPHGCVLYDGQIVRKIMNREALF